MKMSFDEDIQHESDCDGIDLKWMRDDDDSSDDEEWAEVGDGGGAGPNLLSNEASLRNRLRRIILRNPTTRINISIVYITMKLLLCGLYVIRVCLDNHLEYACNGVPCNETMLKNYESEGFTKTKINWYVLLWVHRPMPLWIVEVAFAFITFTKSCLLVAVTGKGNIFAMLASRFFFLETLCCVPQIVSIFWPPALQHLFMPLFLNCWLALMSLKRLLNDFHLAKARFQTMSVTLSQQSWFLIATLFCLIFTTICGIQHIQRGSMDKPLNMFEAVYFVIVTLSTVGFGDISPDIWLGQLFMMLMICVAFSFIPRQLEEIGSTWAQRKRMGGDFGKRASAKSKHVVVIATEFTTESVMSFLSEFFEHPKLEHYTVILMSSEELDDNMQFILKDPKWALRVLYIRGSALKDIDLRRCRIKDAEACFFLVNKKCHDMDKSDQHTVLRSWAVKDFAPNCAQYIQLHKASNKIHVKFAEHVVCEDEFKFALLANNCLYPGLSTLVTLILHTSRGHEGAGAPESWQQVYGRHSGNEIYHIQLQKSTFFRRYEGTRFSFASMEVYEKYGVSLIAVLDTTALESRLQLNPGPKYVMKATDYCFYMSLAREESVKIPSKLANEKKGTSETRNKNIAIIVKEMNKWMKQHETNGEERDDESVFSNVTTNMGSALSKEFRKGLEGMPLLMRDTPLRSKSANNEPSSTESFERVHAATVPSEMVQRMINLSKEAFTIGPPPSTINIGTRRTLCHLHREPRALCCVQWGMECDHCSYKIATDKRWDHQLIILSTRWACPGLYNFIIPLRSNYLSLLSLSPIILMFQEEPPRFFLETIAHFPLVFWTRGSVTSLDDLLVAGVNKAAHLVISNIEADPGEEENLSDAETIVTVQKISRMFPHVNIITEVNKASNMRFMHFKARDSYMSKIRKLEKRLKEKALSSLPYMFRLPFAAGQVFSSGMLDRLLYQTFVKGYLISFVRLLLGIDAEKDSGHLSSVRISKATLSQFSTYGELYLGLASTTGEIPIALYRTEKQTPSAVENSGLENAKRDKEKHHRFGQFYHHKETGARLKPSRVSVGTNFYDKDKNSIHYLEEMVHARMESLGLADENERYEIHKPPKTISYVVVNPTPSRKLRTGDMVYVIQPNTMQAVPNKLNRSGGKGPSKLFRSRHISINSASLNNSFGSESEKPVDEPTNIKQSTSPTSSVTTPPSTSLLAPPPLFFKPNMKSDSNGSANSQRGIRFDLWDKDKEGDVGLEMRPRCSSESYKDKRTMLKDKLEKVRNKEVV